MGVAIDPPVVQGPDDPSHARGIRVHPLDVPHHGERPCTAGPVPRDVRRLHQGTGGPVQRGTLADVEPARCAG